MKHQYKQELTEAGRMLVAALLPVLLDYAGDRTLNRVKPKLGQHPVERYASEHTNRALRDLCQVAIQQIDAWQAPRIEVPCDFLKPHAITCETCGSAFLAKRSDARFCGKPGCQKKARRTALSEINGKGDQS